MGQTIGLALIALLCFGINDFLFKRATQQGASAHNIVMTLSLTMFPLLLLYGLVTGDLAANPAALWGTVGAGFSYIGGYSFAKALKSGAVSIAAITFLAEKLTILKLGGFAIAVVAVWLLLGGASNSKTEIPRDALTRVVVATVCVGVAFFCFKLGIHQGATPASVLLAQTIGLSSVATVASILIDKRFTPSSTSVRYGVVIGIIQSIGLGSLLEGLVKGEVSILFPIAQLSFLVTAIMGVLFLKEQVTARKNAGLAAAVGAVAMLGLAVQQ